MRTGTPGFQPERLAEARDSRGMTQLTLSELINRTSSSISRWESGAQLPETEALEELSKALNVPVSFFMQPMTDHGETPLFFRSLASITQTARKRARARLRWAQNISISLQEWVDFPEVNLPRLECSDYRQITNADIERIANECRRVWEIGMGPIDDVLLVIENAGIIVVKEEVGVSNMDGLSNWSLADNRPYIFTARDKETCVRSRMDAAHELGHLVLHHKIKEDTLKKPEDFKEIERQAFYFAGAFLMPAESFSSEIWEPSLNTFVALKERWKTSIAAMIMRCVALGIITEDYQKQIWKYYSSRGWRKNEPLDDILKPENPRLLARSIRLLDDQKVRNRQQLLNDFRLVSSDVESLAGLPRGYMNDNDAELINLPRLKENSDNRNSTPGVIIPFNRET